jgi:hypothetical protein
MILLPIVGARRQEHQLPRRSGHVATWTGSKMLIWGGIDYIYYNNKEGNLRLDGTRLSLSLENLMVRSFFTGDVMKKSHHP